MLIKPIVPEIERRTLRELRAADGQSMTIRGYAALFDTLSEEIYGMFYERVAVGAFTNALKTSDPRCLLNHDPNFVLGRASAGTLRATEDEKGLAIECELPDTQVGRDLMTSIKRGDITQMSFAFSVASDDWQYVGPKLIRTVVEVDELFDVSPVTFPAYDQTSVSANARSKATAMTQRQQEGNGAPAGAGSAGAMKPELQAWFEGEMRRLELTEHS